MSEAATHAPLSQERHASIVAEIIRLNPTAWRVLFAPSDYVFDPCQICATRAGKYPHNDCGLTLMQEMWNLRLAFNGVTDWDTAVEILRSLIEKDDNANRISVGVRFGDRIIEGEALS